MSAQAPFRSVALVGDVLDPAAWSGTAYHFFRAARARGFASEPWRLDPTRLGAARVTWTLGTVLRGRRPGGFQYSTTFERALTAQAPRRLLASDVLSFNPHVPSARRVRAAGGTLSFYIDATFAALSEGRALTLHPMDSRTVAEAREREREQYALAERVVTMARWAAESAVADCGVAPEKVATVLPGANLDLPEDWEFPSPEGRAGVDRDAVLGFVGKDWERKGLPLLCEVRDGLARRGWRARVRAAGNAPPEFARRDGVEFAGFIDKAADPGGFARFLASCDVGCLFSTREALGLTPLEFLRAGVPVAGLMVEGVLDTVPPDAGFRFGLHDTADEIADAFDAYLRDENRQHTFRATARAWSPFLTWDRCVAEMQELWETGRIAQAVSPWNGLPAGTSAASVST